MYFDSLDIMIRRIGGQEMKLLFVHGWSVTHTDTYGGLPEALLQQAPAGLNLEVHHIFLGRYISFHDEVTMDDIARAFEAARKDTIGEEPFSCITHSTGGPVIRTWVALFYGPQNLHQLPLQHLIMLAPANHGSALAQLGKARVGRLKAAFMGVEPGQKVLDWLELGSEQGWQLNRSWLDYDPAGSGFFPFVLTGQFIDKHFYDYLNSYTGEKGSDGVVRVCAANMNYRFVHLRQNVSAAAEMGRESGYKKYRLEVVDESLPTSPRTPMAVLPDASHSESEYGIMRSVTPDNHSQKPVVANIFKCLSVTNQDEYVTVDRDMTALTKNTQELDEDTEHRYAMVVFHIHDDRGNEIEDFDLLLLGTGYDPGRLPKGFFVDRQRNSKKRSWLTYYVDHTIMMNESTEIGFRIIARPQSGFSYYHVGEFRSENIPLSELLIPNQTLMVDIEMVRKVKTNVFGLDPLSEGRKSFSDEKPSNNDIS